MCVLVLVFVFVTCDVAVSCQTIHVKRHLFGEQRVIIIISFVKDNSFLEPTNWGCPDTA
jgi:hypothetical protein